VERQSYRQWGQLMVGATCALLACGIVWSMLADTSGFSARGVAWGFALLAVSYVVFLRPCVRVDDEGIVIRNIVRDVHVPWGSFDEARSTWSLMIDSREGSYASWAIAGTVSPGRDRMAARHSGLGRALSPFRSGPFRVPEPSGPGAASEPTEDPMAGAAPASLSGSSGLAIAGTINRRAITAERAGGADRVIMAWPSVALLAVAIVAVAATSIWG